MDNKIQIARTVTKFVASFSIGHVIGGVLRNATPAPSSKLELYELNVGIFILSAYLGERVVDWTVDKFDETVVAYKIAMDNIEYPVE